MLQSAARSKERKEQHTLVLEAQVDALQAELASSQMELEQLKEDKHKLGASPLSCRCVTQTPCRALGHLLSKPSVRGD